MRKTDTTRLLIRFIVLMAMAWSLLPAVIEPGWAHDGKCPRAWINTTKGYLHPGEKTTLVIAFCPAVAHSRNGEWSSSPAHGTLEETADQDMCHQAEYTAPATADTITISFHCEVLLAGGGGGGGGWTTLVADPRDLYTVELDLDASGVAEAQEETVGGFVGVGTRTALSLSLLPTTVNAGTLTLTPSNAPGGTGSVTFWDSQTGGNPVTDLSWQIGTETYPTTLYAQGVNASSAMRDLELKLTYTAVTTSFEDKVKLTVVKVDLDMADLAEDKEDTPGGFVQLNNDDDNTNSIADNEETGTVTGENDLVAISISFQPSTLNSGQLKLEATQGSARVKVWQTATKGTAVVLPKTWDLGGETPPATLYVEGYQRSNAPRDVTLKLSLSHSGQETHQDELTATVDRVDLDIAGTTEANEETMGAFVELNSDDDNNNGTADNSETGNVANEDDLVAITIFPTQGLKKQLKLEAASGGAKVKVWTTANKGTEVTLPKTWQGGTDTIPEALYVEGVAISSSLRDITLTLKYIDGETTLDDDTVNLTVVKVEINKCDSAFLPTGGTGDNSDNSTIITATATPSALQGKFKFTLYGVSNEPGYCMNAPNPPLSTGEDSSSWKDLQFPSQTGFTITGTNNDVAETTATNLHQTPVTVKSFDCGAYGQIKCEFTVTSNALTFLATEQGNTIKYTNIPLDGDGNHIADTSWPYNNGQATDDNEDVGQVPGHTGDGFSRYEEYRGFVINGQHYRLNPNTNKDVFVFDWDSLGIGDFVNLGVTVHVIDRQHYGLEVQEGTGAINFNSGTAPNGTQHGIFLANWNFTENLPLGQTVTRLNNPCARSFIGLQNILSWYGENRAPEALCEVLGHELGHACNLNHHPVNNTNRDCVMWNDADVNDRLPHTYCGENPGCLHLFFLH